MPDQHTSPRLKYNARVFAFFKTSGPTATVASGEGLLYMLYCKIRSPCISQGLQVGHEWSEFKVFSLHVLRNVILKVPINCQNAL